MLGHLLTKISQVTIKSLIFKSNLWEGFNDWGNLWEGWQHRVEEEAKGEAEDEHQHPF